MTAESGSAPPGEATALEDDRTADAPGVPALDAPDAAYTSARWISRRTVDWVNNANKIMLEHGSVEGRAICDKRYKARWRAQRLMRLMVELRLHERWELSEHVERVPDGWRWIVEYKGG